MSTMRDDYEANKDKKYTKSEIIQGLLIISKYAGAVVGALAIATWVLTTGVPFLAGLGVPITIGTLAAGCKALNYSWRNLSKSEKDKVIAALAWVGRAVNIASWF